MTKRIQKFEIKQFIIGFPKNLNDHSTLFGGTTMKFLGEVAFITAK